MPGAHTGRRCNAAVGGTLACAAVLAGCATPSLSYDDYQQKVASSAKSMTSIVSTAVLSAEAWDQGKLMSSYADTVVTDSEQDAGSVITALDSRQPPDQRSIQLKDKADQPLQDASNGLTDLRIALRRGDRDGVRQAVDELQQLLRQLAPLEQVG